MDTDQLRQRAVQLTIIAGRYAQDAAKAEHAWREAKAAYLAQPSHYQPGKIVNTRRRDAGELMLARQREFAEAMGRAWAARETADAAWRDVAAASSA